MKILVAYGSERGGTAGIAERIAATLRERGDDVTLAPAERVRDVRGYDAVVLGGALYAFRWHAAARRFVMRHAKALREREVWTFSSGPLDDSASKKEIAPIPQVQRLIDHVGARGHATFGGRLEANAKGFPASAMAKESAGDWRDWQRIESWARELRAALDAPAPARAAPKPLPSRTLPLALAAIGGIASLALAALLALARAEWIDALLLASLVALPLLATAWAHAVRADYAAFASVAAGLALAIAALVALATSAPAAPALVGLALALAILADATSRSAKIIAEWRDLAKTLPEPPDRTAPTTRPA